MKKQTEYQFYKDQIEALNKARVIKSLPSDAIDFVGWMEKNFYERLYGTFVYKSQLQGNTDNKQYTKEDLYEKWQKERGNVL